MRTGLLVVDAGTPAVDFTVDSTSVKRSPVDGVTVEAEVALVLNETIVVGACVTLSVISMVATAALLETSSVVLSAEVETSDGFTVVIKVRCEESAASSVVV